MLPLLRMITVILLAFTATTPARASWPKNLSLTGYCKNFSTVLDPAIHLSAGADGHLFGMVTNRLRMELSCKVSEWLSIDAAYDLTPRFQDPAILENTIFAASIDASQYRIADLRRRLYPGEGKPQASFDIIQNLDRAQATISTYAADIFIGRQAISWGSARAISPTDVIAPFVFDELDTEDRTGVDALRVRFPTGTMAEVDVGYVAGDDGRYEKSAFYLRTKTHVMHSDVSLLVMGFRENLLVGADLARAAGGAGTWIEAAYVLANAPGGLGEVEDDNYFRCTIGCDYNLRSGLYGFIEYHFNGAGTEKPENYLSILAKPAYIYGAVYLLGQHYLAPGLTWQMTPLVTVGTQSLWNLTDPSILLAPAIEYNLTEDIYVGGGAFIGIGKRPEAPPGESVPLPVRMKSEFGGYWDIYYADFRIYF